MTPLSKQDSRTLTWAALLICAISAPCAAMLGATAYTIRMTGGARTSYVFLLVLTFFTAASIYVLAQAVAVAFGRPPVQRLLWGVVAIVAWLAFLIWMAGPAVYRAALSGLFG